MEKTATRQPSKGRKRAIVVKPVSLEVPTLAEFSVPQATHRPFDTEHGETIGNLGRNFKVVPVQKWADTTMFAEAVRLAQGAFSRTSARGTPFTTDNVLVQEYHKQDRIAFVFALWARQTGMRTWGWLYLPVVMRLTAPLKAHFVLTGRWGKGH